ncbi:McrC family protein [Vibrio parahaemolyticus]
MGANNSPLHNGNGVASGHPVVFEFGFLCSDKNASIQHGFCHVSERSFEYLESLFFNEQSASQHDLEQRDSNVSQFLQLRIRFGYKVLQVKNYVGVIFTPHGQHIEVLPKIAKTAEDFELGVTESRSKLLMMLRHLGEFRHLATDSASVDTLKMPLLEVFIKQFLDSVNQLVKRGLRSDYVRREDNLAFQKGKLKVSKQLRHNVVNKHKFFVEYDEYLQDRPANRLIRAALKKVASYTRANVNQRLLRELDFVFDEVPASLNAKQDFARVKLDRSMSYYQAPLAWARLILEGFSPLSMKGTSSAQSLLFPMESVFESYVASVLSEQLIPEAKLHTQTTSEYLVQHQNRRQFQLRPDLLITHREGTSSEGIKLVLDTKWKLIDIQAKNYGLAQSDFYQMLAYGQNYQDGAGDLVLIYPRHDGFQEPIEFSFEFTKDLRLWVVPFEIEQGGLSRLITRDYHPFHKLMKSEPPHL